MRRAPPSPPIQPDAPPTASGTYLGTSSKVAALAIPMPVPRIAIPTIAGRAVVANVMTEAPASIVKKLTTATASLPNRPLRLPPGTRINESYTVKTPERRPAIQSVSVW